MDLIAKLFFQHRELVALLDGVPPDFLVKRHIPDKWSCQENVAHLCRYQQVFEARVTAILTEDHPTFSHYRAEDDHEFNLLTLDTRNLIEIYQNERSMLWARFQEMTPAELDRTGTHPKLGTMSLHDWLHFFLLHESHHIYTLFWLIHEYRRPNMNPG